MPKKDSRGRPVPAYDNSIQYSLTPAKRGDVAAGVAGMLQQYNREDQYMILGAARLLLNLDRSVRCDRCGCENDDDDCDCVCHDAYNENATPWKPTKGAKEPLKKGLKKKPDRYDEEDEDEDDDC